MNDPPVDLRALGGLEGIIVRLIFVRSRSRTWIAERERMSLRTGSRRFLSTLTAVGMVAAPR